LPRSRRQPIVIHPFRGVAKLIQINARAVRPGQINGHVGAYIERTV
jgi:hypothetical protein